MVFDLGVFLGFILSAGIATLVSHFLTKRFIIHERNKMDVIYTLYIEQFNSKISEINDRLLEVQNSGSLQNLERQSRIRDIVFLYSQYFDSIFAVLNRCDEVTFHDKYWKVKPLFDKYLNYFKNTNPNVLTNDHIGFVNEFFRIYQNLK